MMYTSRHRKKETNVFTEFPSANQQFKIEFRILFSVNREHLQNVGYEINFQRLLD